MVGDLYDQLGRLRTMEMILGLDPLNMNDGMAAPLLSLFTEKPDESPYRLPEPFKFLTPRTRTFTASSWSRKKTGHCPKSSAPKEPHPPTSASPRKIRAEGPPPGPGVFPFR